MANDIPNDWRGMGWVMNRYVVEAKWSANSHVVHRVVVRNPVKYRELAWVSFSDGTYLNISVRPAKRYEHVNEIRGYDALIAGCIRENVHSVDLLLDRNAGRVKA